MSLLLTKGEAVALPEAGKVALGVDSTGAAYLLLADGTRVSVGAGGDPGTLVTLGADTADWDVITAYDGDVSGDIELTINLLKGNVGAGATNYTVQPNALATNQERGSLLHTIGTSIATLPAAGDWFIADSADGAIVSGRMIITAKTGRIRTLSGVCGRAGFRYYSMHTWTDTAANLTSVRIHSSLATGIAAGSTARWRKLTFAV